MDSGEERMSFVEDFKKKIKKVRVVTFLDEKQAGGKAVAREKLLFGLASTEKLPAPFRVVLFQKNLQKKRICVLCDFSSFEKSRTEERLENFLHPEKETDSGVWCTSCRKFQCRICLQELQELGLGVHSDFQHLDNFLLQSPEHVANVASCSSCSLKRKMPPIIKTTHVDQHIHQQWDGVLWFPEYGLVVPNCLQTFDLHALAQFSSRERGVLHGLVSPEMALHLEDSGIKAIGTKQATATSIISVKIKCNELQRHVEAKIQLCVYPRCNTTYTDSCLGSDITEQEAREATCVLTKKDMENAKNQGIDIVCLIGDTSDRTLKDRFLLVGRVLPTSSLLGKVDWKPDSLFKALQEKLPKNGYESRRFGGSSGKARFDKDLLNFLHCGGTTCRQGIGTILEPSKDGRNWFFIYKSAYSQTFKRVRYSPPVLGGQVDPIRIQWNDVLLSDFGEAYASIKTLLPYILEAVNKSASANFSFALSAIQDELKTIKAAFKESTKKKVPFNQVIVKQHTITLLQAAVKLHRDKAHRSVKRGDQDCSFIEYKFVFEVPSETNRLSTMHTPVARLRGGAGRRRAAVAGATHKTK